VSNTLRYDPLLVRYLARELHARLAGRACAAAPHFERGRVASVPLDGGEVLRLDLHPTRGWVRILPSPTDAEAPELDAVCTGVEAPPDERLLWIHLTAQDRFRSSRRRLAVELQTNQLNAVLVDADDRTLAVLWSRAAGDRLLRAGQPYRPPAASRRFGTGEVDEAAARERWERELGGLPPGERRGALLRGFALTGAPNAGPILGEAARTADPAALRAAFERWWWLRGLPPAEPAVLATGGGPLPYPVRLPGVPAEPAPSLLAAIARVATGEVAAARAAPSAAGEEEREAALRRLAAAERKVQGLYRELEKVGGAGRVRGTADLLLAHLHLVPRGAALVRLAGWDGEEVEIPLDPASTAAENAARLYQQAKRLARAEERIPELLEEAEREALRWREALAAAEVGPLPGWARERLEAGSPSRTEEPAGRAVPRPFRGFRTSGGLEVRVGRSARENDRLTFQHSSPSDIWLHARSVPGSHVILRWPDAAASPPARDLAEAAGLAALFSKARTSGLVAVDWTRRKHVRKPRGAAPGLVTLQRARTLFVEPEPELEERLRAGERDGGRAGREG
jgi:hypothetical protein